MLLNASFIAFETLNSANSSASSALGLISVLIGSLYHETCNVSSLKDRNSAETISSCSTMQIFVLYGKLILFTFRRISNKGNEVVNPTLIRVCQIPIQAVRSSTLSLTSLTVTSRLCKNKFMSMRWPKHRPGTQASQQTLHCEFGHGDCFCFLEERFQSHF